MKKYLYILSGLLLLLSCGKDKFECEAQNEMAPAGDSSVLFIPNAFSPNGDGLNDVLVPMTKNIQSIQFEVYDSGNKLLFQTHNMDEGWAPAITQESGLILYHYKVTAQSLQGYTYSRCGDVYTCTCLPKGFDASVLYWGDEFDPSSGQWVPGVSAEWGMLNYCK